MSKKASVKKSKSRAPIAAMTVGVEAATDHASGDDLDAILSALDNADNQAQNPEEVIENPDIPGDAELSAANAEIEVREHYESVPSDKEKNEAAKKEAAKQAAEQKAAAKEKAKADKEKKAADAKAERERIKAEKAAVDAAAKAIKQKAKEERKVAKAAEAANKPAPQPRVKYENRTDLMKSRLGDKLGDFMVLETADAALEGDALKAKQDETLALIDGLSLKVKNRANFIMTFLSKGGKLNEVIERAFRVLSKDGKIVTGDGGNLHQNLLSKPYSPDTARATGNNTVAVMRKLKVLLGEGGTYTPNPESLILMMVNKRLGLS